MRSRSDASSSASGGATCGLQASRSISGTGVPGAVTQRSPLTTLAAAGGHWLHRLLEAGRSEVIGIGHGRTLGAVVNNLPRMGTRPAVRFVSCLAMVFLPAFALGATFPMAVRWFGCLAMAWAGAAGADAAVARVEVEALAGQDAAPGDAEEAQETKGSVECSPAGIGRSHAHALVVSPHRYQRARPRGSPQAR